MATEQIDTAVDPAIEAAPNSAAEDEVSLLDVLVVVARRKRMVLRTTIVAALLAAIITLVIPNRYTATTTLLPPQQQQSLGSLLSSQLAGIGAMASLAGKDLGLKNPNDIYIGMLQSREVADSLIQKFELMKVYSDRRMTDARDDLKSATDIKVTKTGLITISVEDKDPKRAAAMANAYVEELRRLNSALTITEAGQRRMFFEEHLKKSKEDLSNAEVALKDTQQKTGLIQLDGQARMIIEAVATVKAQIAAKQVQIQAMQSFATDQNPDLVMARSQLAGLQEQMQKLETQRNTGAGDLQVPTGDVPALGLEYIRRYRDVKYYETIFELLAKQYEAAKLDEARQGAVIQVVDPAIQPDKKSFPPCALILTGVAVAAFFASAFWAVLAESLLRRQQNPRIQRQLAELREAVPWTVRTTVGAAIKRFSTKA